LALDEEEADFMEKSKAFIVGGGLAGLSSAFYLIKDGGFEGENITIFEENQVAGGALDAVIHPEHDAYFMRGFRMLEQFVYSAVFDLMSNLSTLDDPDKTVLEEFNEFNDLVKTLALSRLLKNGKAIDARPFRMTFSDRLKVLRLLVTNEQKLEKVAIDEYFSPSFFKSNLWYEFSTTFSFQPWHSVVEMKRYILRFIQDAHQMDTSECIRSTPLNQFESIVLPLKKRLREKGVKFIKNCSVEDIVFETNGNRKKISQIIVENGKSEVVKLSEDDIVFLSVGSMTADFTVGSMDIPPKESAEKKDSSWVLWEKLAAISTEFGRPSVFNEDVNKSKWVSFTITLKDSLFLQLLEKITKRKAGTEGPVTITDSNWFISFALPNHPHFKGQPHNVNLLWGYGLNPDNPGNFVKKKMGDCSGREIMTELLHHLKFEEHIDKIINSSICIPCLMPYITSQFMPRSNGDRPQVVPDNSENLAFIGQYCEMPDDIVFTLDYSVRSAQTAVYKLLKLDKTPTPIYKGHHNPWIILRTIKTVFR
jgi:oleate hydratase